MSRELLTDRPVNSTYGAPMGRHTGPSLDQEAGPLYLRRVRLDAGGYDSGGAYWGLGQPLWEAMDQDGNIEIFRSRDRAAAKARYPEAKFYR